MKFLGYSKTEKSQEKGKAFGIDNILAEIIIHGGESVIDMLTINCNKI